MFRIDLELDALAERLRFELQRIVAGDLVRRRRARLLALETIGPGGSALASWGLDNSLSEEIRRLVDLLFCQ